MKITDKTFLNSQNCPKTTANFQVFRRCDGPKTIDNAGWYDPGLL